MAEALGTRSAYYLVTQVRSAVGAKPKQRRTLQTLKLGRIGRSILVPAQPSLTGSIMRVSHLLTAVPIEDPVVVPTVSVLGCPPSGRSRSERRRRAVTFTEPINVDLVVDQMPASASLTQAVRQIVRMVRPELSEPQVEAASAVIAEDVQPETLSHDPNDVKEGVERVHDAIANAAATWPQGQRE